MLRQYGLDIKPDNIPAVSAELYPDQVDQLVERTIFFGISLF